VITQDTAESQRFCERCGTALAGGRCPLHGFDVKTNGSTLSSVASPAANTPAPIHNRTPAWSSAPAEPSPPRWEPAPAPRDEPRPPRRSSDSSSWDSSRSSAPSSKWVAVVAAALAVVFLIALIADHLHFQSAADADHRALAKLDQRVSDQLAATNALANKVGGLGTDTAAVARQVLPSVFTIDTPDGLGSGWVVGSSGGNSTLITDYHVVQSVWTSSGAHTVQVKQEGKNLTGTITKVDKGDDLAIVTVKATLTALPRSTTDAQVGDAVLVVGSPLGLSGTVANGIVSSFRNGLIQFSAPISPGDSGGPVVNRQGQVIGVAESKLVGSGVEGLSFAIPISTVCSTVTTC
jgi:putative serine protease PepD